MSAASLPTARRAANGKWLERLGRVGLVAQGLSYAVVGVLALKLALGAGGKTASRQSSFQTLAHDSLGKLLLIALALGFAAYAAWRFANALFDRKGRGDDASGLAKRAGDLGKGLIYAGLVWSVVKVLTTHHASGGNQKKETAGVLSWPAGKWIVLAAALAVLAAAGWNVYRGLSRKFEDQLRRCPDWLTPVAVFGLCARGVVFAVIGWFLAKAALEYDPQKAIGLGGALAKLAQAPYGDFVLGITAAGLIAFAAFCVAQARYRKI